MKRMLILILILSCLFAVAGCSKNTNNTTASESSNAPNNASGNTVSSGKETAQADNALVYYSGKMNLNDIGVEMQKVAADFQAGKIKMEEYIQRLEELNAKMTDAVSSGSSSGTTSGTTQASGNKVIAQKYRGTFISVDTYTLVKKPPRRAIIDFGEGSINSAGFIGSDGESENSSFAGTFWTEGNVLMMERMRTDAKSGTVDFNYVVKWGTFKDANTFVYEADKEFATDEIAMLEFYGGVKNPVFKRQKK